MTAMAFFHRQILSPHVVPCTFRDYTLMCAVGHTMGLVSPESLFTFDSAIFHDRKPFETEKKGSNFRGGEKEVMETKKVNQSFGS